MPDALYQTAKVVTLAMASGVVCHCACPQHLTGTCQTCAGGGQQRTSCPGVSKKVMCLVPPSVDTSTVYAPMACVMPPASPTATLALRM